MRFIVRYRTPDPIRPSARWNCQERLLVMDGGDGAPDDDAVRLAAQRAVGWDAEVDAITASCGREIETPIAREVRLEEEQARDEIEMYYLRGICAPDW